MPEFLLTPPRLLAMLIYTLRRVLGMLPTLLIISALCFAVIKLQPGSFTDQYLEDPRFTRPPSRPLPGNSASISRPSCNTGAGYGASSRGWISGIHSPPTPQS